MRYVLYHAAQRKIKPRQADFVTAYLNSKTKELSRALIDEPEGFVIKWFTNNGYRISDADPCLMISNQGDLAFAWVDDLILV